MKVLISGASGFIGSNLCKHLGKKNHQIFRLSRKPSNNPQDVFWNPAEGKIDKSKLEELQIDSVVHLSGENMLGIWTNSKKKEIMDSRVNSTRLLCEAITSMKNKPSSFLCASGISYYGRDTKGEVVDESTPYPSSGGGFLAEVSKAWEDQTKILAGVKSSDGKIIRVVNMRFGVVLDPSGGMLGQMLLPFKLGLGGVLGEGTNYFPWITLHDHLRAIEFLLENPQSSGAFNLVAPQEITNQVFTKALGSALNRPTFFWVPPFVLKGGSYVVGELIEEAVISDIRAKPTRLIESGFKFDNPTIDQALQTMLQ